MDMPLKSVRLLRLGFVLLILVGAVDIGVAHAVNFRDKQYCESYGQMAEMFAAGREKGATRESFSQSIRQHFVGEEIAVIEGLLDVAYSTDAPPPVVRAAILKACNAEDSAEDSDALADEVEKGRKKEGGWARPSEQPKAK